ncbi:uncharacterized protein LOC143193667 [Rhynchophorus ferrugineus]|uniref:uncharacterized protein LOC143193667 n=1 Tax=Rhynchophorus ferrugineus TaxID=354439 RepID=UPI003FCC2CCD
MNSVINKTIETKPWHTVWEVFRKIGVQRGQTAPTQEEATVEGANRREGGKIRKYHPEADPTEKQEITEAIADITNDSWPSTEIGEESITDQEVEAAMNMLKTRKAVGLDGIPNELIKQIWSTQKISIITLCRNCYDIRKKSGGERPISLLPTLGKVLDRILNRRLQVILERMNLHDERQYGLRRNKSTITAISDLLNWINTEKAKGRANYNATKTEAIWIWSGVKRRAPYLSLGEVSILPADKLEYLGITIDRRQQYVDHVTKGAKADTERIRKKLAAAQRSVLIAVTGAYRTTSNDALQVIAGTSPLHIDAVTQAWATARYDYPNGPKKPDPKEQPWPWGHVKKQRAGIGLVAKTASDQTIRRSIRIQDKTTARTVEFVAIRLAIDEVERLNLPGLVEITTDSRMANCWLEDTETRINKIAETQQRLVQMARRGKVISVKWQKRLESTESTEADELARQATNLGDAELAELCLVSQSTIKEEKKTEVHRRWQDYWDKSEKGRTLYKFCPKVGFETLAVSNKATQLITGHGNLGAYIARFKLQDTTGQCQCGGGFEDIEHILFNCTRPERVSTRAEHPFCYESAQLRKANGMNDQAAIRLVNDIVEKLIGDTVVEREPSQSTSQEQPLGANIPDE